MAANNGTKARLAAFKQNPTVKKWLDGSTLKASTLGIYIKYLMEFLNGQDPAQFLKQIEADPKQASIDLKGQLAKIYRHSTSKANQTAFAIRNLLEFYEVEGIKIRTKELKVKRQRKKPYLSWTDAERIIVETEEPYRSIFRFMMFSGLGQDEFYEIQRDKKLQANINAQRSNDKPYIRIDLEPRKDNVDFFYSLIPKNKVPEFPLVTHTIGNRGGTLVKPYDLRENWRRAAKKAQLWQPGLGPHTLMSTFESTAGKAGVDSAVIEATRGHGSADRYGYRREDEEYEEYVAEELTKLWHFAEPATKEELHGVQTENQRLKQIVIENLERQRSELAEEIEAVTNPSVEPPELGEEELRAADESVSEAAKRMKAEYERLTNQLRELGITAEPVKRLPPVPRSKPMRAKK